MAEEHQATEHKSRKLTGAFELFSKSKDAVQRNLTTFAILLLLPFISTLVNSYGNHAGKTSSFTNSGFSNVSGFPSSQLAILGGAAFVIVVAMFIVSALIQAMTYTLQLQAAEGKTPALAHLWEVAKKYWLRLIGLAIMVAIFVFLGFILLVIPGVIAIRRYILAPYFLIDKNLSISDAMSQSAAATKPVSGYIYSIIGVMILLNLTGFIPAIGPIIAFVLSALYSVAPALRYHEIRHAH